MPDIGDTELRLARLMSAVGQADPSRQIDPADALLVLQAIADTVAARGARRKAPGFPDVDPWMLARARLAVLFFDQIGGDRPAQ